MKFCPKCGKIGESGLCASCMEKDSKAKQRELTICSTCQRYRYKNTWKEYDDLHALIARIAGSDNITILKKKAFTIGMQIKIKKEQCSFCQKRGSYFEGVLQLRNYSPKIEEYVSGFVEDHYSDGLYISKQVSVRDGFDLYFSSNKYLKKIATLLEKNFGCTISVNPRLQTKDRQTSKDLYRLNILVQCPRYTKGDVIVVAGRLIQLSDIRGSIKGLDLFSGKRVSLPKTSKIELLTREKTRVIAIYPQIEVLDPEDNQPVIIQNKVSCQINENVKIVKFQGKVYLTS